jgi:gluconate 5-dehydrogenase
MNQLDLKGRTAVVTGGLIGIGAAIVKRLEASGAKVRIWDLGAKGDPVDVADQGAVEHATAKALADLGRIDILVNNAGIAGPTFPVVEYPVADWKKVIDVDLNGPFLCCRAVVPHMVKAGYGRIVNIASVAGLQGSLPDRLRSIAYNTTKGGVVNFTRALAGEWGQYGITVNAICPGFFPSKMTEVKLKEIAGRVIADAPLRRLGGDEDLKGLAALFASDASQHITGQVVAVDGGSTIV